MFWISDFFQLWNICTHMRNLGELDQSLNTNLICVSPVLVCIAWRSFQTTFLVSQSSDQFTTWVWMWNFPLVTSYWCSESSRLETRHGSACLSSQHLGYGGQRRLKVPKFETSLKLRNKQWQLPPQPPKRVRVQIFQLGMVKLQWLTPRTTIATSPQSPLCLSISKYCWTNSFH